MLRNSKRRQLDRGVMFVLSSLAVALIFCIGLEAQQLNRATLRGTAEDPSGAVVPGVAIELSNATGVSRTATTDSQGNYELSDLNNGTYRLAGTSKGFTSFVAENITLTSGEIRRVDVHLRVGSTESTVNVNAGAAVIQTETGTISSTLTAKTWDAVPLAFYSYNPYSIMLPMAGTYHQGGSIGVSGISGHSTNAQIATCEEGVCEPGSGISQSSDAFAVQEVKVFANSATAEYSRPANIDLVYKTGNNDFHGQVYYNGQNSALNARDYFNSTGAKPLFKNHMFGIHVSGPIKKDKLFYYVSWDEQRVPSSTFIRLTQPTTLMQSGDFSQLLALASPIVITDPQTSAPFPGNIIPQDRISQTSLNIQNTFILQPNIGSSDNLVNNYGYIFPHPSDLSKSDHPNVRIDYNVTKKNTLYGMLLEEFIPYVLAAGSGYPNLGWTRYRHHSILVLSDTHVFSPTLVNTFRWAWNKDRLSDGDKQYGFTPLKGGDLVTAIGLEGVNPKALNVMGSPRFDFTTVSSIIAGRTGGIPQDDRNFDYADSVTWSVGKHVLKFGGEFRTYRDFASFGSLPTDLFGEYQFNGAFSGYDYADFLLGLPQATNRTDPIVDRVQTATEAGFFIQDTFKVTPRLNLDYGVRWDYFGAPRYQDGLMYNWDPTTGAVVVPNDKLAQVSPQYPSNIQIVGGDVLISPYKKNFRPRVGAAYRLTENTVIRGSYGQFTLPFNIGSIDRWSFNQGGGPYQISQLYTNSITGGVPLFQFPNAFASAVSGSPAQSVVGYPRDVHNGVAHEFNLTIEHEFHDMGIRVSYVGNRNRSLAYNVNINKPMPSTTPFTSSRNPYPQFVTASTLEDNGATNYNALEAEFQRKVGRLNFNVNWDWTSSLANYLNLQNPYDILEWTNDGIAPRHRVVITAAYELPIGQGQRFFHNASGVAQQIVGGWHLYYAAFLATGGYFSPTFSGSDPSHTNTVGGIADQVCNGNLPRDRRSVTHWFDTSCYAVPADGTFGDARVNSLEGPGFDAHHISLTKTFPLHGERVHMEYQLLLSNIFNHPNFLNPNANISSPSAGQITSTVNFYDAEQGASRRMEMKLRVIW